MYPPRPDPEFSIKTIRFDNKINEICFGKIRNLSHFNY